jgi:hypothetical protein
MLPVEHQQVTTVEPVDTEDAENDEIQSDYSGFHGGFRLEIQRISLVSLNKPKGDVRLVTRM